MSKFLSCRYFIILLLPLLVYCNNQKQKRTDNIITYLGKNQHVILNEDSIYHVAVLQNGMCGACDFSQLKFIQGLTKKQIIAILQMPDSFIVNQLSSLPNVSL